MNWRPATVFVVASTALALTLIPLAWFQNELGARFAFPLLVLAFGIPSVVALCTQTELAPIRLQRSDRKRARSRDRARTERGAQRKQGGAGRGRAGQKLVAAEPLVRQPSRVRTAALCGAVFAGWVLLSTVLSPHPALALFGQFDAGNGALLSLSFVAAWSIGITSGAEVAGLLELTLLACVGLNAVVALYQAGLGVGLFAGRAPGFMFNPVVLGSVMIGGLWLVACRFRSDWRPWAVAAVVVSAAMQVSGSRLELTLLPLLVVAAVVPLGVRRAGLLALCIIAGVLLGTGVARLGAQSPSAAVAASASTSAAGTGTARLLESGSSGVRPRLEAWSMAAHAIGERPLQGWGPGRFREATTRYRTLRFSITEGPDRAFEDAHNVVVEYATTTGVVGVVLLLAFVGLAISVAGFQAPLAGFALLCLLAMMAEPQHSELTPVVFLALGAAASARLPVDLRFPDPVRVAAIGVALLVAAVIALGSIQMQAGLHGGPARQAAKAHSLRTARALLRPWAEPLVATAILYDPVDPAVAAGWERQAVRREPYQDHYWSDAGALVERAQGIGQAGELYRQALVRNPWSPPALVGYAKYLSSQGRRPEAMAELTKALKVVPDDPAALRAQKAITGSGN